MPDEGEEGIHMHSGGLVWGLGLEYGKEAVSGEEGPSIEYMSWSSIWRMSSVKDGDSCSEQTERAGVG